MGRSEIIKRCMTLVIGLTMLCFVPAFAAKNTQSKFPESVMSVKLSVDGPVVIHTGSRRSEVKVTSSESESKKLRIAYDATSLEIGANALVSQGMKPKVEKVEIWMDDLHNVSVYGISDVTLGTVSTTTLNVYYYGVGTLRADLLDTTSFNLQLFGRANADIKRINGTGMHMALAGVGDIAIGSQDITTLDMVLSGVGNVDLGTIDATTVDINVSGQGKVKVRGDATVARFYCGAGGSIDSAGLETTRTIYTDISKALDTGSDDSFTIENPGQTFEFGNIEGLESLKGLQGLESLQGLEGMKGLDGLDETIGKSLDTLGESLKNAFENIDWTGGTVVRPQKSGGVNKSGGKLVRP